MALVGMVAGDPVLVALPFTHPSFRFCPEGWPARKCVQVTMAAGRHGRSRSQGGPRPTRARQGKHRAAGRRDGTGGSRWRVMRWRFPQRGVPAPWRHQRMGAGLFASARISCALQLGRLYRRCRPCAALAVMARQPASTDPCAAVPRSRAGIRARAAGSPAVTDPERILARLPQYSELPI